MPILQQERLCWISFPAVQEGAEGLRLGIWSPLPATLHLGVGPKLSHMTLAQKVPALVNALPLPS